MLSLVVGALLAAAPLSDSTPKVALLPSDTLRSDSARTQHRKATAVSEWYAMRLTIHKVGAFAEFPVFAAQYYVGQRLYSGKSGRDSGLSDVHAALAGSLGFLFATNTITGAWNLWDSRAEPKGRTRRIVHAVLMMASDAGFLATAALADDDRGPGGGARLHRQVAITSMSISALGTVMMWVWRD